MATAPKLSPTELSQIAERIADALPPTLEPRVGEIELSETFEVWSVINPSAADLASAVRPTGTFHHQLLAGGVPVGYARSRLESTGWDVSVFVSPFAAKIGEAIDQADAQVPDGFETRLFVAERLRIYALWFVQSSPTKTGNDDPQPATSSVSLSDRFFVIASPDAFANRIELGMIDGAVLLQRIAMLKQFGGVTADPPGGSVLPPV